MEKIEFVVITKVPDILDPEGGNLCHNFLYKYYDRINNEDTYVVGISELPAAKPYASCKDPVFYEGEIVICNENGREVDGPERAPRKWFIEYALVLHCCPFRLVFGFAEELCVIPLRLLWLLLPY